MSTIKEHIDTLKKNAYELTGKVATEDEVEAVNKLSTQIMITEAVFKERKADYEKEKLDVGCGDVE